VLGEVPLPDVGVVVLELWEELFHGWETAVLFADAGDAVDDELAEAVVVDEVEEPPWKFTEYGILVVFDEFGSGPSCECENKIRGQTDAPSPGNEGEWGLCLCRVLS
jgi:hypothetical protein